MEVSNQIWKIPKSVFAMQLIFIKSSFSSLMSLNFNIEVSVGRFFGVVLFGG